MNRSAMGLALLARSFAAATAHYASRYHAERERSAALEARVAMLAARPGASRQPPPPADTAAPATPAAAPPTPADAAPRLSADRHAGPGANLPPGVDERQLLEFRQRNFERRREHARRLREDPEYRAALLGQYERSARRMHEGVELELGFTRAEADAFFTQLAEAQLRMQEAEPLPLDGAIDGEARQRETAARLQASAADSDARLRETLGDARYQQWHDFQRSAPARREVRDVRDALAGSAHALEPAQERQLVAAVAQELAADREWYRAQGERLSARGAAPQPAEVAQLNEEWLARREAANRRLLDAARPVLDPQQLATFDELRRQRLTLERAQFQAVPGAPGLVTVGPGIAWLGAGTVPDY